MRIQTFARESANLYVHFRACLVPAPSPPPLRCPQLALDDDKTYGLRIGTLKSALKSRGWKWLWP